MAPLVYSPPWPLRSGLLHTLSVGLAIPWALKVRMPLPLPGLPLNYALPPYQGAIWSGADGVPLYVQHTRGGSPRGTLLATYGVTGSLQDQWSLHLLASKAYGQGWSVILFDWRAHGRSAELSPTLTSDGLREGADFGHLALGAWQAGYPPPFWFVGYSLGGQLALWGAEALRRGQVADFDPALVGGVAAVCPNLDSWRSLQYLMAHPWGRYLERAISRNLQSLAWQLHRYHPQHIDGEAIQRADSILGFDRELVISPLGFATVRDYYQACSPLPFLPQLKTPTFILYAADDPLFDPDLMPELVAIAQRNPAITLYLTQYGGHGGYLSDRPTQAHWRDPDCWWAWNRVLEWMGGPTNKEKLI